jgi:hypothetical protein
MKKTNDELLDYIANHVEWLEEDISNVDREEMPNAYWYTSGAIVAYKDIYTKIKNEYS